MQETVVLNCCCLTNSLCSNDGVTIPIEVTKELYEALMQDPPSATLMCDICEGELKVLGEQVSGGFLKINSMDPHQKRQALKKRSQEHFKKKVLDQRVDMIRNCDKEFKKM